MQVNLKSFTKKNEKFTENAFKELTFFDKCGIIFTLIYYGGSVTWNLK